jgi:hypothetical protein
VGVLALLWASTAWAADTPLIRPPDAWVRPSLVPVATPGDEDAKPIRNLLTEFQVNLDDKGEQIFSHLATKIQNPAALGAANLAVNWNPQTQTLIIHQLHILRGSQVIDLLRTQKFTVLRRETDLERAALNGVLTATLQPAGLQVGDTLDFAYTVQTRDPVMHGHSEAFLTLFPDITIDHLQMRAIWTGTKNVRWRETVGLSDAVVTHNGGATELTIREDQAQRPTPPKNAPPRYSFLSVLELSDFQKWSDVSALFEPLFTKAATISPGSPLNAEVDRIRASSADPKAQATAALRLVEDNIRYLYLGLNQGGYVPADADLTWSRRFGDCKAKTALLLALLHKLGIEAEPALVSTTLGDGMNSRLPNVDLFDHVLVRAQIGGKTYWLDGTRTGDRDLDSIELPQMRWALPVTASGSDLIPFDPPSPARPSVEAHLDIDASAGLDGLALVHIETVIRGDAATAMRLGLASKTSADQDKALRDFFTSTYPATEIARVGASNDDKTGDERLTMDGVEPLDWETNPAFQRRELSLTDSRLGGQIDVKRDPGPNADAPFATPYPLYVIGSETIRLPQNGKGFVLANDDDINKTIGGIEYKRVSRLDGGVFTVTTGVRATALEFPFSEAQSVKAQLNEIAETPYLRAPVGYRPSDAELQIRLTRKPVLASEFADRAQARILKADYDGGLEDYDSALKLKPDDSDLLNARCFARAIANRTLDAALDDCNSALEQQPHAAAFLDSRAFVYFRIGSLDKAVEDLNAALKLDPQAATSLFVRGVIEKRIGNVRQSAIDIAAAQTIDPTVADTYAGYGVRP